MSLFRKSLLALVAAGALLQLSAADPALLNVSYDVTREFYKEYNPLFSAHWKSTNGANVAINQSHGGSSKQVRSVIDGLAADVVTMNGVPDVDQLAKVKLIPADWAKRLPNESVPYTSTILFIVRKGNPKGIKDWSDLVREGVQVVIPNPKTSGNGRYSYLGAWIYALKQPGGDEAKAREFVKKLFANVPVLDTGGRGATTTFAQRGIGDVLLTFENEVALTIKELGEDQVEGVVPSSSILAENPVVWVDKVTKKHGTDALAKAYLEYLYSPAAQELVAKYNFRPIDKTVFAKHSSRFPNIPLYSVPEIFGSWDKAQTAHFSDGGVFDQIYVKQ
ncbi:sulfate ABC transporter substrate-binding protein [Oleiharenicola lentus]|uniref:sulfate ABC transporter substrate-binding protein n=1 Tax=Oleiharenicola lentus TaxID=2508720 RepID=UPI003F666ED8